MAIAILPRTVSIQERGSRCRYRVRTCTHQDAPDTRSSPTTGFVHHAQLTKFTTFIQIGDELQVHRLQHQHIANWGAMMATRGAAPHSPYTNPVTCKCEKRQSYY